MTNTTLLIGGTGKTGRRVAERLTARGIDVRIGSRRGTPPFDWDDESTWGPALDGVRAAYVTYYPDLTFPGATEKIAAFSKLAAARGVEHLVLLSGRGEERAEAGERALQSAGTGWTIVRSSWFSQNFSEDFLLDPVLTGDIALPAGDVAEPFTDAEDIADVVAAALTDPRHRGRTYELTGPRSLGFADVAFELSRATGRTITYTPVTTEQYRDILREHGMPLEFADLFAGILDGRNAEPADGVRQALGRPARDFADYAREAAATGVWG
ncbi:MAG TPA: NmrA family transcriptional regulator [Actinoplanes sp.]|nr:NmrA family transcriptional regulator [Actinoplanes sp.]